MCVVSSSASTARVSFGQAATAYQRFLDENPDEPAAMELWEAAPLVDDVESGTP